MADITLISRPAFPDFAQANSDRVSMRERRRLAIATIGVAPNALVEVNPALSEAYSLVLPRPGRRTASDNIAFIWAGPHAWLAIADAAAGRDLERELKQKLGALASITDASDGRAVVRISGDRARAILARGLPIDLHPNAFKTDDVATTHAAHIGVTIWQIDDSPTYDLAVSRSYAEGFAHWLMAAAASEAAAPL